MNKYKRTSKETLLLISRDDEEFKKYLTDYWISEHKDFIIENLRKNKEFPAASIIEKFRKEHENWAIDESHTNIIITWVEHFRKIALIKNGGDLE